MFQRLRAEGRRLPVVVLTGRPEFRDAVQCLDDGADDYMTKPFRFEELLRAVRVHLHAPRTAEVAEEPAVGGVRLDMLGRRVTVNGRRIDLTAREFALLKLLMRHHDQVLSRSQILSHVWGYTAEPGTNVVNVFVSALRRKLGGGFIESVRGVGYRMRGDLDPSSTPSEPDPGTVTARFDANDTGGVVTDPRVGNPRHWLGLLGSMRVRIVLAVALLLSLSAGVSIILLRNVLLDRLDEEITVALDREAEEFAILADGDNPRTGEPFGDDFEALFDLYLAREVPDEGETLLAFVDGRVYDDEGLADGGIRGAAGRRDRLLADTGHPGGGHVGHRRRQRPVRDPPADRRRPRRPVRRSQLSGNGAGRDQRRRAHPGLCPVRDDRDRVPARAGAGWASAPSLEPARRHRPDDLGHRSDQADPGARERRGRRASRPRSTTCWNGSSGPTRHNDASSTTPATSCALR